MTHSKFVATLRWCFKTFTRLLNQDKYHDHCVTIHVCGRGTTLGNKKCTLKEAMRVGTLYAHGRDVFVLKLRNIPVVHIAICLKLDKHNEGKTRTHPEYSPHASCLLGRLIIARTRLQLGWPTQRNDGP